MNTRDLKGYFLLALVFLFISTIAVLAFLVLSQAKIHWILLLLLGFGIAANRLLKEIEF
ncbi:MAG: hypothetical protein AAGG68_10775 [Bacteroidota bacterium]